MPVLKTKRLLRDVLNMYSKAFFLKPLWLVGSKRLLLLSVAPIEYAGSRFKFRQMSSASSARDTMQAHSKCSSTSMTAKLQLNRILIDSLNCFQQSHQFTNISQNLVPYVTPNVGKNLEFGDYQTNIALLLSKSMGMKPIDVANKIASSIRDDIARLKDKGQFPIEKGGGSISSVDMIDEIQISGPGFINFRISTDYMVKKLLIMSSDPERVGIERIGDPQRVVVDFSSPNIAKDMHVGHLRSTIIGNCLSNVLQFIGHDVLRINHVGDWGTQFGMLISYMKQEHPEMISRLLNGNSEQYDQRLVEQLADHYRASKILFDSDETFKETCRRQVVQLQSGADQLAFGVWRSICGASRLEFKAIYDLLGVEKLVERGESFYQTMLPKLVDELLNSGHAVIHEGAVIVELSSLSKHTNDSNNTYSASNSSAEGPPFMIRKTDGGFLYATTDLAAILHRVESEKALQIMYVTDSGQAQHFAGLFKVARYCGLISNNVTLKHIPFGLVQGGDGKRLRTRDGNSIKLKALLMESIVRSENEMKRRKVERMKSSSNHSTSGGNLGNQEVKLDISNVVLSDEELAIAKIIGLSSVKYNDLCMNRNSDYQFSFDKMLSMNGNTYCYLLYVYVRIEGIRKKIAELQRNDVHTGEIREIKIQKSEEIFLSRQLIRFDEILMDVCSDHMPHKLCEYMYELSSRFNSFYENCSIVGTQDSSEKYSRAKLCDATSYVLYLSLNLLGIETVDRL